MAQLKDPNHGQTVAGSAYIDWKAVAQTRDKIIKDVQKWIADHKAQDEKAPH